LLRRVVSNRRGFLPAQDARRKTQDLFVPGSPKRRVEASTDLLKDH